MRDRLADRHVRARQRREAAPQLGEQLGARPAGLAQADVDLRRFDALHVLVVLGAAGPPRRRDDLRLRQQDLLDAPADLVGLRQRRARAACSPARSGCPRGTPAGTPCPSAVIAATAAGEQHAATTRSTRPG